VSVTADRLTPTTDLLRGTVGLAVGGFFVLTGVRYVVGDSGGDVRIPGVRRVTSWLAASVHRHVNSPSIVALGALGLGTIPAVFLCGTVVQSVDVAHRRRIHRLLGVAVVALGYVLFAHGLMAFGVRLPHPLFPHYRPLGGTGHRRVQWGRSRCSPLSPRWPR